MAKYWLVYKDGVQYGPFSPEDLKHKAESGELRPDDHVRPDDRQNWFKASTVKGLFTSIASGNSQAFPPSLSKQSIETEPSKNQEDSNRPTSCRVECDDTNSNPKEKNSNHLQCSTNVNDIAIAGRETISSPNNGESVTQNSPANKPSLFGNGNGIIFIIAGTILIFIFIGLLHQGSIDHPEYSDMQLVGVALGGVVCVGLFIALILFVVIGIKESENERTQKLVKMSPDEQKEFFADELAMKNKRLWGPINPPMVCPHCQTVGCVRGQAMLQKSGISGAKATGAILTGGLSILATGLSQKENKTQAHCDKCGSTWIF